VKREKEEERLCTSLYFICDMKLSRSRVALQDGENKPESMRPQQKKKKKKAEADVEATAGKNIS
jgi:hypothetical protein